MQITSIDLYSQSSAYSDPSLQCSLSLNDPRNTNPYQIKFASGLDADEIVAQYYGIGGGYYGDNKRHNMVLKKRLIVLKIGLNPNFITSQTYSTLRDTLYKTISSSPGGGLILNFMNGGVCEAKVVGYIEKFESDLFAKTQEVQLTINCPNPLLRAPEQVEFDIGAIDPFNSLIYDNVSTAPHGMTFGVRMTQETDSLAIQVDPSGHWWEVRGPAIMDGFKPGDLVEVSTEFGERSVTIQRFEGDYPIPIADSISAFSIWPIVFPGATYMRIVNRYGGGVPGVFEYIRHTPTFWGI